MLDHGRTQSEVEARSGCDPPGVAHRGQGFRQKDEQGDSITPGRRERGPDGADRSLDCGRSGLGQADDRDENNDEKAQTDEKSRDWTARAGMRFGIGVVYFDRQEVVAMANCLHEHEQPVENNGRDGGKGELFGRELRSGPAGRKTREHQAEGGEGRDSCGKSSGGSTYSV